MAGGIRRASVGSHFLVAPSSTPERLAATVEALRGFVYGAEALGRGMRCRRRHPVGRVKAVSDIPVSVWCAVARFKPR